MTKLLACKTLCHFYGPPCMYSVSYVGTISAIIHFVEYTFDDTFRVDFAYLSLPVEHNPQTTSSSSVLCCRLHFVSAVFVFETCHPHCFLIMFQIIFGVFFSLYVYCSLDQFFWHCQHCFTRESSTKLLLSAA